MDNAIVYVDRSRVLPGKSAEVRQAIHDLVAFVEAHEPQLLAYNFYLDDDASEITLVAVHPDSASLERHVSVAGDAFRRFIPLIELRSIELYGDPTDDVMQKMHDKARMLGAGDRVVVQHLQAGFMRMPQAARA